MEKIQNLLRDALKEAEDLADELFYHRMAAQLRNEHGYVPHPPEPACFFMLQFPEGIESLRFNDDFNVPVSNLRFPQSLKSLTFTHPDLRWSQANDL